MTVSFADVIGTLFPEVIEIGIPVICGFSFEEYTYPNICYWCSSIGIVVKESMLLFKGPIVSVRLWRCCSSMSLYFVQSC